MVHRVTELTTGKTFAMKVFDRKFLSSQRKDADVTIEEHCLRRTNHPGIAKLHALFSDDGSRYLALEYCPGGELWALVKDVGLSDDLGRHYLSQIIEAVAYLRDAKIVHRDLKAENVLLGQRGNCKLVDFGSAKDLANPHIKGAGTQAFKTVQHDNVGTPNFQAPECCANKFSDFRSDIWSLGCLIYQVLTGWPPFGTTQYTVYKRSAKARLKIPSGLHGGAQDLIRRMVVLDPNARLGGSNIQQVRSHPFFISMNDMGSRFQGAHKRCAPVLSLGDVCLRTIGRSWSRFATRASAAWVEAQGDQLRPETGAILARFRALGEANAARERRNQEIERGGAGDSDSSASGN